MLSREQFDQELAGIKDQLAQMGITEEQARRKFFRKAIAPGLKGQNKDAKSAALTEWGIVGQAPKVDAVSNPIEAFGKGFARQMGDNTITGQAARLAKKGLTGNGDSFFQGELMTTNPVADKAEIGGRLLADIADPLGNLIGGKLGKLAGVGAAKIPTLARVSPQVIGGAVGGGTQGVTSAVAQGVLDGQVNPNQVATSGLMGLLLGGAGAYKARGPIKANEFDPTDAPQMTSQRWALPPTPQEAAVLKDLVDQGYTPEQIVRLRRGQQAAAKNERDHGTHDPQRPVEVSPVPTAPKMLVENNPVPAGPVGSTGKVSLGAKDPNKAFVKPSGEAPFDRNDLTNKLMFHYEVAANTGNTDAMRKIEAAVEALARRDEGEQIDPLPLIREALSAANPSKAVADGSATANLKITLSPDSNGTRIVTVHDNGQEYRYGVQVHRGVTLKSVKEAVVRRHLEKRSGGQLFADGVDNSVTIRRSTGNNLDTLGNGDIDRHYAALEAEHNQRVAEAQAGYEQAVANNDLEAAIQHARAGMELTNPDGTVNLYAGLHPKAVGQALGKVHNDLSNVANKAVGAVTETLSKATDGKLKGGYDLLKGEDRLGNQLAEGYDWLLNEANTGGKAPIVDKVLELARRGLSSDKGLPKDYVNLRKAMDEQGRTLQNRGQDLGKSLKDTLTPEQDSQLYDVLNDRTATNTDLKNVSEPIRQEITDLSRKANELGALGDEAFAANEGQYLKRLYDRYLNQAPTVARWANTFSRSIQGSKFRGKQRTLSQKAFDVFSKPWEVVRDNGDGTTLIKAGAETRNVPNKHLGDFLGDWKQLQKRKNGDVVGWRDYTRDERTAMGEHRVASDALVATMNQIARDLPRAQFLKDIASNSEWAVKEGGEVPAGWVHFSNEKNAGKTNKWGALAGHYVHPDIAFDLKMAEFERSNPLYRNWKAVLGELKKNWTSRNPASHMNNFMQNTLTLELNGGSMADFPEALKAVKQQGDLFKQLRDAGLYDNTFTMVELGKHISLEKPSFIGALKETMNGVAKVDGGKVLKGIGQADARIGDLYSGVDDLFRTALVIGKMRNGMSLHDAVKLARERMYNPQTNAPAIKVLRDTGFIPFIRAAHWSVAEVPKMILRNPGKAALLGTYWMVYNQLVNAYNGDSKEQVAAREHLVPDYLKAPMGFAPVPGKDTKGQRMIIDTKNWMPWSFMDTTDRAAIPNLPTALQPGGPWATVYGLANNWDGFRQQKIRNPSEPWLDQAGDVAGYAWNTLGPAGLSRAGDKVARAALGKADSAGRRYDLPTAALNAAGVKVQPFDDQEAYVKLVKGFQREIRGAREVISEAQRQYARGAISQADLIAKTKSQQALIKQIAERAGRELKAAKSK